MLKVTTRGKGATTAIELNGLDIGRFLYRVEIVVDVEGIPEATLHYRGAVEVEGEELRILLEQSSPVGTTG